jgi:hypothetical protein
MLGVAGVIDITEQNHPLLLLWQSADEPAYLVHLIPLFHFPRYVGVRREVQLFGRASVFIRLTPAQDVVAQILDEGDTIGFGVQYVRKKIREQYNAIMNYESK